MAFLNKARLKDKAQSDTAIEHPLLKKRKLSVAEKTAYLQGCVLAALVDDAKVSDAERSKVRAIGLSLRILDAEIDEAFGLVGGLKTDEEKNQFVDEIVSVLKCEPIRGCFIGDFKDVLMSGNGMKGDAAEIFDLIGARLYEDAAWQKNMALAKAKTDADKEKRTLERELIQTVEDGLDWPAEYDKQRIFDLILQHGFKEHQVSLILSLLLPYAQGAYDAVKRDITRMEYSVDHDRHSLNLCENENALRFMNYVKCMSDCAAFSSDYAIIPSDRTRRSWLDDREFTLIREDAHYFVSLECVDYSHRKRGAREEAIKELLRLYKSLLDEFENMSKF